MVGGKIIEVREDHIGMRLWCMDLTYGDEVAIYVHRQPESNPKPGDDVWWQGDKAYWTPASRFVTDHPMVRVAGTNSFDPRPQ
jgi:hypothetical protein